MSFPITVTEYSARAVVVRFPKENYGSPLYEKFKKTVEDMKKMEGKFRDNYMGGPGWMFSKKHQDVLLEYAKNNSVVNSDSDALPASKSTAEQTPQSAVTQVSPMFNIQNQDVNTSMQLIPVLKPEVGKWLNLMISGRSIPIKIISVTEKDGHVVQASFDVDEVYKQAFKITTNVIQLQPAWSIIDYQFKHNVGNFPVNQ